ncbi:EF-hand calcium binding domain 8, partial [Nowakowskiella sp. JEL0078]
MNSQSVMLPPINTGQSIVTINGIGLQNGGNNGSTTNAGVAKNKVKFYNGGYGRPDGPGKTEINTMKTGSVDLQSKSNKLNVHKDTASYRTEREITLHSFRELMNIFQDASDGGGLSMDEFKKAFGIVLGMGLTDEQMMILFMKIDANTDNSIDWDEFSTFMLLRAEGQNSMREDEETALFNTDPLSRRKFNFPTPHKDMIEKILWLPNLKRYITCSREGTVCYWSDKLKVQRTFRNVGAEINANLLLKKGKIKDIPQSTRASQFRWVHDMVYLENVSKIATASDDHQITIYDFTTMKTEIRLDTEDSIPLCLDFWYDVENPDSNESMLLYGTDSGFVNVYYIVNKFLFNVSGKKEHCTYISMESIPRAHISPVIGSIFGNSLADANNIEISESAKNMGVLSRRKAHQDWCVKVQFFPELHSIVSCSPDPMNSLVVATQSGKKKWNQISAPVRKGVNTFAYCRFPVTIVTGGTDREIRLWNPYRLKHPMAALKGHNSPIIDITINEQSGQIISLSVDKAIKVWDIRKHQCLQTLFDGTLQKPENIISKLLFGPTDLIAASTNFTTYSLKERNKTVEIPRSHEHPLRCALYNSNFKQVVSGCEGSVVNVWV